MSKYERTLQIVNSLSCSYSSNSFSILPLRQAQDRRGERIEKPVFFDRRHSARLPCVE
ncbi:MAG: hypothetical protein LBD67_03255 [Candidatus Accumulibacter sp.]|nr:hypothetical protein [Accumulibacter sp.]